MQIATENWAPAGQRGSPHPGPRFCLKRSEKTAGSDVEKREAEQIVAEIAAIRNPSQVPPGEILIPQVDPKSAEW